MVGGCGAGRSLVIEGDGHDPVSGLLARAPGEAFLCVLGHGAGAPMTHPWMEALAAALAHQGVSTLRYNFSYAERGRRRPDHVRKLLAVVSSAVRKGMELADGTPLLAGGKSMGGRMTSLWTAAAAGGGGPNDNGGRREGNPGSSSAPSGLPAGLVFFGFPLHAPGRRGTERAEHLADVPCPMLFHQGTRDRLADLALLGPVIDGLGGRARLHVVEGGDHSLAVLKRLGRTQDEVLAEAASLTRSWAEALTGAAQGGPAAPAV